LTLLDAYQNGKRIDDLDSALGSVEDLRIEVVDTDGESKQLNLSEAVTLAGKAVCGRYWNEDNATPVAAGNFGSLDMLRRLPELLGLGCYLVQDDRTRRKLDPTNHYKFTDGSPAALNGTMGQYMWCWNAFHFAEWKEGSNHYMAISLTPIEGKKDYYIPAGGTSALGFGVMDRTNSRLCSLISDEAQYRGGNNNASLDGTYATMLGMPATYMSATAFSTAARARGEGWDANWYVSQAVTEILYQIIMGNRNSQMAVNAVKDANGLWQGGLGEGVTNFTALAGDNSTWALHNGTYPIVPTSVGVELGDGVGEVSYDVIASDGATVAKTVKVPVFFGLKHPFGHLWKHQRGLIVNVGAEKTEIYVAPSLYSGYIDTTVDGLLKVSEMPRTTAYIKKKSWYLLNAMPTEVGGSASTYYCDYLWQSTSQGLRVRLCGARAGNGTNAGSFAANATNAASAADTNVSSPLCYFEEDPEMSL